MKRKKNYLSLLTAMLLFAVDCLAQPVLSKNQWLEDVDVLEKSVYHKHVNPFWKTPKPVYEALFASVRNRINTAGPTGLQPEMIMTDFAKILALTADGHSGVSTKSRGELFGVYNYNVAWFPEGLYITRAEEANKHVIGARITRIDDMPVEEVRKHILAVSTSFSEQGFKRFSPRYVESPAVLYGSGISKSPQQVTLTIMMENGNASTVTFQKQSLKEQERTKFISLNELATYTLPLYRQLRRKNYWFEYLPENKLMYVNYNLSQNSKDEPMDVFVKRLAEEVAKKDIDKFVVDIRSNPGGDQFIAWPLLDLIYHNSKINQPGKLFALTGSASFSAATAFLEALEMKTNCIIAGAATPDSPEYPAEDKTYVLPNSKMEVRLSDEMWNYSIDNDSRNMIEPAIAVTTGFADYSQGKDPVLEAVIKYQHTQNNQVTPGAEKFTGRYQFGIDKALDIVNENGILKAVIKGRLRTTLTPLSGNKFQSAIKGLSFAFGNNEITIQYPDGKLVTCRKLAEGELTAFDLVFSRQTDKALKAYEALKEKNPGNSNLSGATLAGLAFYLLVETKDIALSKSLLDIAIALNPHSDVANGLAGALKDPNVVKRLQQ